MRVQPVLEKTLICAEKAEVPLLFPPVVPFRASGPSQFYISAISERFGLAQDGLIIRLGEANWQRHNHLRNMPLQPDSHFGKASEGIDNATAVFRPYSAFQDSGIGTTTNEETEYAASHSSYLSSIGNAHTERLRVPRAPKEVSERKSFICPICRTRMRLRSRVDWK